MSTQIRLRTRSLKIVTNQGEAAAIVMPLVAMAAYGLSIGDTVVMSQAETYSKAMQDAKQRLAGLLSMATLEYVQASELSEVTAQVMPGTGKFKVRVQRTTHLLVNNTTQTLSVLLTSKDDQTLLNKLHAIESKLMRITVTDQSTLKTIRAIKRMAL